MRRYFATNVKRCICGYSTFSTTIRVAVVDSTSCFARSRLAMAALASTDWAAAAPFKSKSARNSMWIVLAMGPCKLCTAQGHSDASNLRVPG